MYPLPGFGIELLRLPLRYEWKLSRNTSVEKINGLVRVEGEGFSGTGEVAPNIRYGETPQRILAEFGECLSIIEAKGNSGIPWVDILKHLPACQALKAGLDMAMLNWLAARQGMPLYAYLKLPAPRARKICYTIPVMDPAEIEGFVSSENLSRFSWLKLKVNEASALDMLQQTLIHFPGKIAIDGNEAWADPDKVLGFAERLPKGRILFLEQPLPASMKADYPFLKEKSDIEIWGDESVLGEAEPAYWKSAFSGVNVKLMKTGGIQNAVHMLQAARSAGLKTMIGCMVETSVGIAAAMQLESLADFMDLDGFLLPAEEPFALVKEKNGEVQLTT